MCGLGAWMENGIGCGSQAVAPRVGGVGKRRSGALWGVEETETRFVHRCQCQSVATTAAWHICSGQWRRWPRKEPAKSANAARRRMATPKTSYTSRSNVNLVGSVCICWIRGTLAGVYICVLSLPLKIASKMWNEIVARQEVYAATASSAAISDAAAYNKHTYTHTLTHRYADTFLEIQSRSAARDRSDSWSGLPLALWFMRAAQIYIYAYICIYTAGKHTPHFCLCILAFPELNLIFCLNCGRTNVEKFF